jgi:hypothetical protein
MPSNHLRAQAMVPKPNKAAVRPADPTVSLNSGRRYVSSQSSPVEAGTSASTPENRVGVGVNMKKNQTAWKLSGEEESKMLAADLMAQKLRIVDVENDGNCLYRAIAAQVLGDEGKHVEVRKNCAIQMAKERSVLAASLGDQSYGRYLKNVSEGGWGGSIELCATMSFYKFNVREF